VEELQNFLGGTFHQDINSPDEALEEYINSVDRDWILMIRDVAVSFLKSDLSEDEKSKFIRTHTEIYFPAIGLTPIKWLETVTDELKKSI
jgi:hypothetical protein